MNDYHYWGYAKLAYMAEQIAKGRPYSVYSSDNIPLFGLAGENPIVLKLKTKEEIYAKSNHK